MTQVQCYCGVLVSCIGVTGWVYEWFLPYEYVVYCYVGMCSLVGVLAHSGFYAHPTSIPLGVHPFIHPAVS